MAEAEIEVSHDETKKIYKDLVKYSISESFQTILENGNKTGKDLLEFIKEEFKTRDKPELVKSELDKVVIYKEFITGLIEEIDNSVGGKIFKKELERQLGVCDSHIELKVEVGFDAPIYSKADMMKADRGNWINIDKKLQEFISKYAPKDDKKVDLDPYEE